MSAEILLILLFVIDIKFSLLVELIIEFVVEEIIVKFIMLKLVILIEFIKDEKGQNGKRIFDLTLINEDVHRPPRLWIEWGSLQYLGYLASCTQNFTKFNSSGQPVRAVLNCQFVVLGSGDWNYEQFLNDAVLEGVKGVENASLQPPPKIRKRNRAAANQTRKIA